MMKNENVEHAAKTVLIPEARPSLRSCLHSHHLRLTDNCMARSAANNIRVTSIVAENSETAYMIMIIIE